MRQKLHLPSGLSFAIVLALLVAIIGQVNRANGEDWARFLGTKGAATSAEINIPTQWDAKKNIKWKTEMPGPGSSSPIVYGDHIYITCYTGYGAGSDGTAGDLMRHLICIDRKDGNIAWKKSLDAKSVTNEDPYRSYIKEHGYASSTPVTDGQSIFTFFGKLGAVAFDMKGNELWRRSLGTGSSRMRWGSAASPILHKNLVIVNAVEESGKIFALNKKDGKVKWEYDTKSQLAYSTPNLVETKDGKTELVVGVPSKIVGVDPETGKEKWFAKTPIKNNVSPAVMVNGDVVYLYGGFIGVGSIAVRSGGKGDVTDSHVVWQSRDTVYVSTPVIHKGHIYWVNKSGVAFCVNEKTGEQVYKQRVKGLTGRGNRIYASMVVVGDNVVVVSRKAGTFVLPAKPSYEIVAHNQIEGDNTDFNGTPAVSGNQMFLRSNKYLYCISK